MPYTKSILLLMTFLCLFISFSCSKENTPLENTEVVPPAKDEHTTPINPVLNNALQVVQSEKIISEIILNTLKELYFYPELYGFTPSEISAGTRTDCPESSLNAAQTELLLTYSDCPTTSTVQYSGSILLTIDGTLGTYGTTILIELSDDFTVAGDRDLDGFVFLFYDDVQTNDEYEIQDIEIDNNNLTNFTTTEIRPNQSGQTPYVFVIDVENNDTSNPLTLLDNEFHVEPYFQVICPNADGTFTELEVFPLNPIEYTLDCGMPKNGTIELTKDGVLQSSINFSYPNFADMGVCDNELIVYPAAGGTGTVVTY